MALQMISFWIIFGLLLLAISCRDIAGSVIRVSKAREYLEVRGRKILIFR
jgi:hypothetical protein